jgi:Cft2 family RNA processing exonuclease
MYGVGRGRVSTDKRASASCSWSSTEACTETHDIKSTLASPTQPPKKAPLSATNMQGTLAAELLTNPREVMASDGRVLKVRASISAFSFSAHADYSQTSSFIEALAPAHVILCHGNQNEMERLRKALVKQAMTAKAERIIHTPKVATVLTVALLATAVPLIDHLANT